MLQYDGILELRDRGLTSRFLIGSALLHLLLAAMLLVKLPALLSSPRPQEPLTVTILDPSALDDLRVGPMTQLPEKPRNILPGPRANPSPRSRGTDRPPAPRDTVAPPDRIGLPHQGGVTAPASHGPVSQFPLIGEVAPALRERATPAEPDVAPTPPTGGSPPSRLPFVSRNDLDQLMSKLYAEPPRASKDPASVNTEDLLYLSYIAQIARTLELVWKYPKEAGDLGQEGSTILKVTILADGTLQATELMKTSGHPLLDDEAVRAIKRIAPYPPLPKSWQRDQWDLTISFSYYIHRVSVGVI